jgi:aryl-alcohol dehydrogenase-like predicted oxidoreductase
VKRHVLGQGLEVSAFGIGCNAMADENYGPTDEAESLRTLHAALDMGVGFWDTSETYGRNHGNEILLGKVIAERRDEVIIATKFGLQVDHIASEDRVAAGSAGEVSAPSGDALRISVNSRPEVIGPSCDASLRRLNVDYIDLYYQHRLDPDVPIEETWGALHELVLAGKVRYLGMCEPGLQTLRRAHAVHPVAAVQSEYSLFSRDPEGEALDTLRELGIGLVCFAPLCRGFLSGQFRSPDDFGPGDIRSFLPRFQGENFYKNLELVGRITALAAGIGLTATQLALAWLLHQGNDIVPIPGIERRDRLHENAVAADVTLSNEIATELNDMFANGAAGGRLVPGDESTHYVDTAVKTAH